MPGDISAIYYSVKLYTLFAMDGDGLDFEA